MRIVQTCAQRRRTTLRALAALILCIGAPAAASAQAERVEYYALDAIGSVRVVFDANGTILGRMDFGPFGMDLNGATGMPPERFAGLTRDGEAGLDYAQARMYQWRTGRFSAPDRVYAGMFNPQGWNRYSYGLNQPTGIIDVTGLDPQGTWYPPGTETCGGGPCGTFSSGTTAGGGTPTGGGSGGSPTAPWGWSGAGGDGFFVIDEVDFGGGFGGGGVGSGQAPTPPGPTPLGPTPPGPTPPGPNKPPLNGEPKIGPRIWRIDPNVSMAFLNGCVAGFAASVDGAVPFIDPIASLGLYDENMPGINFSKTSGGWGMSVLAGVGALRWLASAASAATRGSALYRIANNPFVRVGYGPSPSGRIPRIAIGASPDPARIHISLTICRR